MPGLTLPTLSYAEVKSHNSKKSCYVTIGTKVYDLTSFLDDHPGGAELILGWAGKDVEKILKDEEHHVDWLEGQLHAISEMGMENYLAQQLHKGEEEED